MPITWQNINAPSSDSALRGFAVAGQNINSAFDKLGGLVKEAEAFNQGVRDREDESNVLAIKEAYSKAKTPQEVAAVQALMESRVAGLSNKGRTAVLGAEDARTAAVQQQIAAQNAFKDGLLKRDRDAQLTAIQHPVAVQNAEAVAANAPLVRQLERAGLDQKVALQPITDATQIQTAQNANRAATFAGQRAPGLEALTLKEDSLKGQTLSVQAKQTQNAIEDQGMEALIAQTAGAYKTAQLESRTKLGALASKLKLPVDASGAPDMARMDQGQLLRLDHEAILEGLPTTKDLFAGDTKAANQFVQSLSKTGRFTPEAVMRNEARINGAFNTTNNGAALGNDAYNNALKQAKIDTAQESSDANNWYAPNSPNAMKNHDELSKEVSALFQGTNMAEDLPDLQAFLYKAATTGIEVKKGVFLTPSKQDILAAVRTQMGNNNVWNSSRARQVEDFLKENLSTARVTELQLQAERSKALNEQRSVREKVRESLGIGQNKK